MSTRSYHGGLWLLKSALIVGGTLILVVIGLGAQLTLRHEYQSEVDGVLLQAQQTAEKLASRTAEVFDHVNQTTLLIRFLAERGDATRLDAMQRAGVLSGELAKSVMTTDRRGNVTDATSEHTALNVADEDDFKRLRRAADLDLLIGLPAKNPLTNEWSIPVSRRLVDPAGQFGGVTTVAVDPQSLSGAFGRNEASDTAVGILGLDGVYRARALAGSVTFGERVDVPALERRIAEMRDTRDPVASPIDGVSRFVVRARVDRYPLMAVVAVGASSALAGYLHTRLLVVIWSGVLATLVIVFTAWLLYMTNRLAQSRAATARSERAFRATIEGCLDAVTLLEAVRDPSGDLVDLRVVDANRRAAEMLARTPDLIVGRRLCDLSPSIRDDGFLAQFQAVIETGQARSGQVKATDPHVAGRWLHHQVVPLDDGVALITRDVTDQKESENALAEMARVDPLTKLSNRRHFEEALGIARARALRTQRSMALIYVDLDGFKKVNDTLGHAGGDLLLVEVARRLLECVRSTDVVSRLGGDEFTVILENAGSDDDVSEICSRILAALSAAHRIDGHVALATPSIGAVTLVGAETVESLRRRADEAMYAAKRAGKARYWLIPQVSDHAMVGAG